MENRHDNYNHNHIHPAKIWRFLNAHNPKPNSDFEMMAIDSRRLRRLADELKIDCKRLYAVPQYRKEAMKLFRLRIRMTNELHRRRNPAIIHEFN